MYRIFCFVSLLTTFAGNNTCHASHKNSAPGRVFAFYIPQVLLNLNLQSQ